MSALRRLRTTSARTAQRLTEAGWHVWHDGYTWICEAPSR